MAYQRVEDESSTGGMDRRDFIKTGGAIMAGGPLAGDAVVGEVLVGSHDAVKLCLGSFFSHNRAVNAGYSHWHFLCRNPILASISGFVGTGEWERPGSGEQHPNDAQDVKTIIASMVAQVKQQYDVTMALRQKFSLETLPGKPDTSLAAWLDGIKPDYVMLRTVQINAAYDYLAACPEIQGEDRTACQREIEMAQRKLRTGNLSDVDLRSLSGMLNGESMNLATQIVAPRMAKTGCQDTLTRQKAVLSKHSPATHGCLERIHRAFNSIFDADPHVISFDKHNNLRHGSRYAQRVFYYDGVEEPIPNSELSQLFTGAHFATVEEMRTQLVTQLVDSCTRLVLCPSNDNEYLNDMHLLTHADRLDAIRPRTPGTAEAAEAQLKKLIPAERVLMAVIDELPRQIKQHFGIEIPADSRLVALRKAIMQSKAILQRTIRQPEKKEDDKPAKENPSANEAALGYHGPHAYEALEPLGGEMEMDPIARAGQPGRADNWLARTIGAKFPKNTPTKS